MKVIDTEMPTWLLLTNLEQCRLEYPDTHREGSMNGLYRRNVPGAYVNEDKCAEILGPALCDYEKPLTLYGFYEGASESVQVRVIKNWTWGEQCRISARELADFYNSHITDTD